MSLSQRVYENKRAMWTGLVVGGLVLAYGIYMLMYLDAAKKCDPMLSKRDRDTRKVALVVTWITVVLMGLTVLGIAIGLLAGSNRPVSPREIVRLGEQEFAGGAY